ncbi:MAG: 3-oxoacyl-ACP reductase FabG [Deltaproteobacteria bacterium]|nr:3-oxoacyl-ACP reductase FabG [Deltaproteobacteria bacterium]
MDLGLGGKIALVTGSAQGLGRDIALALAREGASLVLADIVDPFETAGQIQDAGGQCLAVRADISDEDEVASLFDQTQARFGRLDIVVNNAGISQLSYTPTVEMPVEEWDKIVRTNLRGTFLCCQQAGKLMIDGRGGSIVNVATTAGISGVPRAPAYCASKAGIILLSKSLALEWAEYNIRVNAIAPHYLETELTKNLRASDKVFEALARQIPLRRFGQTSEVVGAVLFLSSEVSSYTTGAVLAVDGGFLAK